MSTVRIGNHLVGDDQPCFVIAEIGINHNGDIDLAKRLISVAVAAGCDAVKFQKRTVDVVYTAEELAKPRESPVRPDQWRSEECARIRAGRVRGDRRFLPVSQNVLVCFSVGRGIGRFFGALRLRLSIRSPPPVLPMTICFATFAQTGKPVILSTGMSTYEEIDHAVDVLGKTI